MRLHKRVNTVLIPFRHSLGDGVTADVTKQNIHKKNQEMTLAPQRDSRQRLILIGDGNTFVPVYYI